MDFITFKTVADTEVGTGVYADVINHCKDYRSFVVPGDKPTSAHECTHGINAALRNRAGAGYHLMVEGPVVGPLRKIIPSWDYFGPEEDDGASGSGVNAFYLLKDRAVVVPEPSFGKSEIIPLLPPAFRGPRFDLYISGQQDWEGQPLYVWDEWSAYINGAMAATDMARSGELKGGGTDWVYGPLEFIPYSLAVAMKADQKNELVGVLRDACRFQLVRAFNAYLDGRSYWPFEGQDAIYHELALGQAGAPFRDFMTKRLGVAVPTAVQPEDQGVLDSSIFKVVGN